MPTVGIHGVVWVFLVVVSVRVRRDGNMLSEIMTPLNDEDDALVDPPISSLPPPGETTTPDVLLEG